MTSKMSNGIYDILKYMICKMLQEMLEAEMDTTIGYGKKHVGGKMILQSYGKEFFLSTVSTFLSKRG